MGTIVVEGCKELGRLVQKLGPYLLVEMLLPGGTLLALALFLYQRRDTPMPPHLRVLQGLVVRAIDALRSPLAAVAKPYRTAASIWRGRHRRRDGLEPLSFAP